MLTGEPCAGEPHARFGGRGGANQCVVPTPIQGVANKFTPTLVQPSAFTLLPLVQSPSPFDLLVGFVHFFEFFFGKFEKLFGKAFGNNFVGVVFHDLGTVGFL